MQRPTIKTAFVAVLASVTLAACTPSSPGGPAPWSETPTASEPVEVESTTPAPQATPELVADEFSQVLDGVLFQGTETAPVRIGTDTPGQPPAAEAGFVAAEGWELYLEQSDKYAVSIMPGYSDNVGGVSGGHFVGWFWKVFGLSRFGSVRELDNSGYQAGSYLPNREAALAGPYTVDGRVLDRAEYILVPISDRYAAIP
ncbi:hypothetical protein [Actinotalea solisilvae]|uniref:hypothetical protein n=1 Tax=Actinotalea solisilvae TaxID=2072922 RepID=UPI0018F18FD0|nr:hypothetical protein [Actinotalea solisilvae]